MSDESLAPDAAMDAEPIAVSAPVVATERIDAIDKLRGLAVAGILITCADHRR